MCSLNTTFKSFLFLFSSSWAGEKLSKIVGSVYRKQRTLRPYKTRTSADPFDIQPAFIPSSLNPSEIRKKQRWQYSGPYHYSVKSTRPLFNAYMASNKPLIPWYKVGFFIWVIRNGLIVAPGSRQSAHINFRSFGTYLFVKGGLRHWIDIFFMRSYWV